VTKPTLPDDHQAAIEVPQGGSMCANCRFLSDDKKNCGEPNFIAWEGRDKPAGSSKLPLPADRYCSDWYMPKAGALERINPMPMIERLVQIVKDIVP
jgi:hypothetical protein